jgi:uncharacterized spore protein YtfJ
MNYEQLMQKMGEAVTAGRSFGPAVESSGCTLLPVAWVFGGGGGGQSATEDVGSGFGYFSIPMGAYVIKDGDVRFKPAYDVGFLGILGVSAVRALRRRRRLRSR